MIIKSHLLLFMLLVLQVTGLSIAGELTDSDSPGKELLFDSHCSTECGESSGYYSEKHRTNEGQEAGESDRVWDSQGASGDMPDEEDEQLLSEKTYEQLVDALMEIPYEHFQFSEEKLFSGLLTLSVGVMKCKKTPVKGLLAKAAIKLVRNNTTKARGEARCFLLAADPEKVVKNQYDINARDQILAWLMMYKYRNIQEGSASRRDVAELHSYFHKITKQENPEIIVLKALYFLGGLEGVTSSVDIEHFSTLLNQLKDYISQYHIHYIYPISFTSIDRMRWVATDDSVIIDMDVKMESMNETKAVIYYILMSYLGEWAGFSDKKIEVPIYAEGDGRRYLIKSIKYSFHKMWINFNSDLDSQSKGSQSKGSQCATYITKTTGIISEIKKNNIMVDNGFVIGFLYQLCAIVEREGDEINRRHFQVHNKKILALYKQAAEYSSSLWSKVLLYALKICDIDAALEACEKLACSWKEINENMSIYWEDRKESIQREKEMESLKKQASLAAGGNESYEPLDWLPEADLKVTEDQSGKSKKTKGKRKNKIQKSVAVSTYVPSKPLDGEPEKGESEEMKPLPRSVISVGKNKVNRDDRTKTEEGWVTQGKRKNLKPYMNIFSKNWNPLVITVLSEVNRYKREGNYDAQHNAYQRFFENEKHKTITGFQRLSEEIAWMELHKFDGAFALNVLPENMRKEALATVDRVRNTYLLPAIAVLLGYDEMNSSLTPEAYISRVESVLSAINQMTYKEQSEYVYRAASLASSNGHTFSLEAMVKPRNSALGKFARSWYNVSKRFKVKAGHIRDMQ